MLGPQPHLAKNAVLTHRPGKLCLDNAFTILLRGTNFRFTASSASKRTVQRPTCRWLTTGQRNDVLPLGRVQQRRRPGTSALVQSRFRAPLLIALAREPHRLRRQPDTGGHLANRLAVGQPTVEAPKPAIPFVPAAARRSA